MPMPTVMPKDLSETGRKVYRQALKTYGRTLQGFRDEETMLGAKEIAEAGLGTYREPYGEETYQSGYLWVTPLAKGFTTAIGGRTDPHYLYVEVEVLTNDNEDKGVLLIALHGASLDRRDSQGRNPLPTWRLAVKHATATDFEHDTSIIADLTLSNPVFSQVTGRETVLFATLTAMNAYAHGVDPLTVPGENRDPGEMCDGEHYKGDHEPHPYAPYSPPDNSDFDAYLGKTVKVTCTSVALVDQNGHPTKGTDA